MESRHLQSETFELKISLEWILAEFILHVNNKVIHIFIIVIMENINKILKETKNYKWWFLRGNQSIVEIFKNEN